MAVLSSVCTAPINLFVGFPEFVMIVVVVIIIQVVKGGHNIFVFFIQKRRTDSCCILQMGRNNKQKQTNQARFELFEIVWTKICGYPWWPSKITDILTVDASKIPEGDLSRIKLNGKAILSSKFIKPKPKTPSKLPAPIEQKTIYKVQFIGETTYSLLESADIQNYCQNWEKHSSPKISKISQGFYEARRIADTIMGLLKLESEISDEESDKLRHENKNKTQKQTKEKQSNKKDKQSNYKSQKTRKNSQLVCQPVADEKKFDNHPAQNGGQENQKNNKIDNRKMTNFRELNNLNLDSIIVENNRRRLTQPPTPKLLPKTLQKQQPTIPNAIRNLRSIDKKSQNSNKQDQQIFQGESPLEQQPSPYQQKPKNQIIKVDSCFYLNEEQLQRKYNLHLIPKTFDQLRTKKYGNLLQNNSDRKKGMKKKMILKIDAIIKGKFIDQKEVNRKQTIKMAEVLAHQALKGKDVTDSKYHREYIRFFNKISKATASQILGMYREYNQEPLNDNNIEKSELHMKSSEVEVRGI